MATNTYFPWQTYNYSPTPTAGSGTAYGRVPGQIQMPPSRWQQLGTAYPNLTQQTETAASNVMNDLLGELSPTTMQTLQDEAAAYGVKSGLPGSGYAGNRGLRNLGINIEKQKQQGLQNYLNMTGQIGQMQADPNLMAQIAQYNSQLAAAPDPELASLEQQRLWQEKMNAMTRAGSPSGSMPSQSSRIGTPTGTGSNTPIGVSSIPLNWGSQPVVGGSGTLPVYSSPQPQQQPQVQEVPYGQFSPQFDFSNLWSGVSPWQEGVLNLDSLFNYGTPNNAWNFNNMFLSGGMQEPTATNFTNTGAGSGFDLGGFGLNNYDYGSNSLFTGGLESGVLGLTPNFSLGNLGSTPTAGVVINAPVLDNTGSLFNDYTDYSSEDYDWMFDPSYWE